MVSTNTVLPWYKQFWPWFIIALPASVVLACLITIVIAVSNQDSLVADNYYKDGLAINQELAQDKAAKKLAMRAMVTVDKLVGEMRVSLEGDASEWPKTLTILWIHPTNSQADFSVILKLTPVGHYLGQLQESVGGRWYIKLSAPVPEPWLLRGEVDLKKKHQFSLGYSATERSNGGG